LDLKMKNALVRKFQLPQSREVSSQAGSAQSDLSQAPALGTAPAADFEVPEINTNFIDNLFHDSTFLNRFDAAFDQTVPMELTAQPAETASRAAPADASPAGQNMLDLDLPSLPNDGLK
jgi:hypothetical protein